MRPHWRNGFRRTVGRGRPLHNSTDAPGLLRLVFARTNSSVAQTEQSFGIPTENGLGFGFGDVVTVLSGQVGKPLEHLDPTPQRHRPPQGGEVAAEDDPLGANQVMARSHN